MPLFNKPRYLFPTIQAGDDAPFVEQTYLHFTTRDKDIVCRCNRPRRHERWYAVAEYDPLVEAPALQHMERTGSQTCTKAEWKAMVREKDLLPIGESALRLELHYTTQKKDVVCRCHDPGRHRGRIGRVRNEDIHSLATRFFASNPDKIRCRKQDWRAIAVVSAREQTLKPASAPEQAHALGDTHVWASMRPTNALGSMNQWKQVLKGLPDEDHQEPDWILQARHSSAASPSSVTPNRLQSPPPSMLPTYQPTSLTELEQYYGGQSVMSGNTWGGSDSSSSESEKQVLTSPMRNPPSAVTLTEEEEEKGSETFLLGNSWAPLAKDNLFDEKKHEEYLQPASLTSLEEGISDIKSRIGHLSFNPWSARNENSATMPRETKTAPRKVPVIQEEDVDFVVPGGFPAMLPEQLNRGRSVIPSQLIELPAEMPPLPEAVTNYGPKSISSRHRRSICVEKTPASRLPVPTPNLRMMLHKPGLPALYPELPFQGQFFYEGVTPCAHSTSIPTDECCKICKVHFRLQQKTRTIQLRVCGHYAHADCLLEHFRCRDENFGTCPTCDVLLCERTLTDRINTDKDAIFDQESFTALVQNVYIDFLKKGQVIHCASEEELAVAQLRIMKYLVGRCMEEAWSRCLEGSGEPDWYAVVRAAIDQFREQGMPARQCRYISNQDAFLKFILWAELVRLMNCSRAAARRLNNPHAPFPSLNALHEKFLLAKNRFDEEKISFPKDRYGVVHCDLIAKDAYDLAMKTL